MEALPLAQTRLQKSKQAQIEINITFVIFISYPNLNKKSPEYYNCNIQAVVLCLARFQKQGLF